MKTQTIQGLIKEECAYHENVNPNNKITNYCYTGEMPEGECMYFMKNPDNYWIIRCKYFEECVLPLNKELEIKYWERIREDLNPVELKELNIKISKNSKPSLVCQCGKVFKAKSNRQKMCPDCQKKNRRLSQRKLMKEKREKK